ncbi:SDR family oxidoreductase [Acinetobacter radioresistens]|uniref:SDR family oxidoreductase n=1 Tax=Acinetobacter radioresistens TaxID=40216 RepID=UPI0006199733|nr:SDR family oxidoreductase [Acinetobacter radioresistens]
MSKINKVLITGGARGIGAAIAQQCKKNGWYPIILDKESADIEVDLLDVEATAAALKKLLKDGPITRLVNNVGMVKPDNIENQSLDDFNQVLSLNVRCSLQCIQALLPNMKSENFGRIVNMSSRAALGKTQRSAYAVSKAGLIGLSRVAALELGVYGITVNSIAPGPIETELFTAANPPDSPVTQQILQSIPVKRLGQPADIAHACSYFLSDEASFVTGQTLYVCGGMSIGATPV